MSEKKNEFAQEIIEIEAESARELSEETLSDVSGGAYYPSDQSGTLTSQKPS